MVFWGFFCFLLFLLQACFWALAALQQLVFLMLLVGQLLAQAAASSSVFQKRAQQGSRGSSQQLLLGRGWGFAVPHCAVAVGGQAAGAGVSQELSGTGAKPWGALVFWPGQRWICEQKLCQPLAIHGSPPLGKSSFMVSFDWDTECTAPRAPGHDGSPWVRAA